MPGQGAVSNYAVLPKLPREALERSSVFDEQVYDVDFK